MSEIILDYGADYPLSGVITNFEAYMFITTPKFIAQHDDVFPCSIHVIDGKTDAKEIPMDSLKNRKDALAAFNKVASNRIPTFPKPNRISCVMMDFTTDGKDYTDEEMKDVYVQISKMFIKWCQENDRAGAIVPHMLQERRWPHTHILYQRARGKHNEFQDWLTEQIK